MDLMKRISLREKELFGSKAPKKLEMDRELEKLSRRIGKQSCKISKRVGPKGRTFHFRVSSIGKKTGGINRAKFGLKYDKREGEHHKNRKDELAIDGGRSTEEMESILDAVDSQTKRINGKLALRFELELPSEMIEKEWQEIAEKLENHLKEKGHPFHWAIHSHNERGEFQPHLHGTTTPRPVIKENDGWNVTVKGPSLIDGPAKMQEFRREIVAKIINEVAEKNNVEMQADWHGGRLEETGIERPAKKRRPIIAIKRENAAKPELDNDLPKTNERIDLGHYTIVKKIRKNWLEEEKKRSEAKNREKSLKIETEKKKARALLKDEIEENNKTIIARERKKATEGQKKFIEAMASELDLKLPKNWQEMDGGDLIAALKVSKKSDDKDREKVFNDKIKELEDKFENAQEEIIDINLENIKRDSELFDKIDELKSNIISKDAKIKDLETNFDLFIRKYNDDFLLAEKNHKKEISDRISRIADERDQWKARANAAEREKALKERDHRPSPDPDPEVMILHRKRISRGQKEIWDTANNQKREEKITAHLYQMVSQMSDKELLQSYVATSIEEQKERNNYKLSKKLIDVVEADQLKSGAEAAEAEIQKRGLEIPPVPVVVAESKPVAQTQNSSTKAKSRGGWGG